MAIVHNNKNKAWYILSIYLKSKLLLLLSVDIIRISLIKNESLKYHKY